MNGSPHTISATYNPAANASFTTSTGTLDGGQTVNPASTTTTVTSSANPSVLGRPVTFAAMVAPVGPGGGIPTGSVQFVIDGSNYGDPVTLSGGSASISDAALPIDGSPHTVTAVYTNSDGNYTGSTGSLTDGQSIAAPGVDLIGDINNDNLPYHIYINQTLSVPVEVTNQGFDTASGTINITFFLSAQTTLDANAVPVRKSLNNLSIDLDSSESETFQASLTIPQGLQSGDYYLIAQINSSHSMTESNYDNNVAVSQQLTLCNNTSVPPTVAQYFNQAITAARQFGPPVLPTGPFPTPGEDYTAANEGGLIPYPYLDSARIPTIGVGINIPANRQKLMKMFGLTNSQINTLMKDARINGSVNPRTGLPSSGKPPVGLGIISVQQLQQYFITVYQAAAANAQNQVESYGVAWYDLSESARISLIDLDYNRGPGNFALFANTGMFEELANGDMVCAAYDMMVARTRNGRGFYVNAVKGRAVSNFRLLVSGFEDEI